MSIVAHYVAARPHYNCTDGLVKFEERTLMIRITGDEIGVPRYIVCDYRPVYFGAGGNIFMGARKVFFQGYRKSKNSAKLIENMYGLDAFVKKFFPKYKLTRIA